MPLALGSLFLLLYGVFAVNLPHPRGEFSYVPALSPLPFAAMRGFTFEQLLLHVGRLAFLGPALVFLGLGLRRVLPVVRLDSERLRRVVMLVCLLSLLVSAFVLTRTLHGRAIVDDELTYSDQARLLAQGRLGDASLPPLGWEPFTIASRVGLTGKYLFGEPLVQVPGSLVGLPGLLHLLLAGLTLGAWFRVATAAAGAQAGAWATMLLALSPMFMFTNGTGLSHTTSLACIAFAGLGLLWCREGRPLAGATLAGGALGFAFTVRPQVALPVGGVLAVVLARDLWRGRRYGALLASLLAGGVFVAAVGWYDWKITGSPLQLPWSLFPIREAMGFSPPHSFLGAWQNLLVSLVRWNGWWLGLPAGLAVIAVWGALGYPARGLRLWALCGAALVLFNFCYYSPGVSETGPVYYFELLLPGSLLAAQVVVGSLTRWPRTASSLLLLHLVVGTGSFVFEQQARLARLHDAIHGRIDFVLAQLETPALLFHEGRRAEKLSLGWVFGFPVRYRSASDPVVTYPRHSPEEVRALRARWAGRHCYYYRIDPATKAPELYPCEQAESLLARPEESDAEGIGQMPLPTAGLLGYFDALSAKPGRP